MVSVLIAAYNEEAVIARCLDALHAQFPAPPTQIVVSANACRDRTASVARAHGADVVERAEAGKSAALNAGEAHLRDFPRVYLDADIVVPPHALASVEAFFADHPEVCAVAPRRRLDVRGRPTAVRAYFAIQRHLPAFTHGLFGRGMIVLSEEGRRRFAQFPDVLSDDLFLDSLFADPEKSVTPGIEVVVAAPKTTRALVRRLVRVRRGNAQLRAAAAELGIAVRPPDRWAWLRVAFRRPWLLPAAIPYVLITLAASRRVHADPDRDDWGHDASTRSTDGDAATDHTTIQAGDT